MNNLTGVQESNSNKFVDHSSNLSMKMDDDQRNKTNFIFKSCDKQIVILFVWSSNIRLKILEFCLAVNTLTKIYP